jgi:hypothetical protein
VFIFLLSVVGRRLRSSVIGPRRSSFVMSSSVIGSDLHSSVICHGLSSFVVRCSVIGPRFCCQLFCHRFPSRLSVGPRLYFSVINLRLRCLVVSSGVSVRLWSVLLLSVPVSVLLLSVIVCSFVVSSFVIGPGLCSVSGPCLRCIVVSSLLSVPVLFYVRLLSVFLLSVPVSVVSFSVIGSCPVLLLSVDVSVCLLPVLLFRSLSLFYCKRLLSVRLLSVLLLSIPVFVLL